MICHFDDSQNLEDCECSRRSDNSGPRYISDRDIEHVEDTLFDKDGICGYDFGGEIFSEKGEHLGFMLDECSDKCSDKCSDECSDDPQEVQWDDGDFSLEY